MGNAFRRHFSPVILIIAFLLLSQVVFAAEIRIAWDPNSEPDFAGYRIYYGTASGPPYGNMIDLGNVTSYTLTGLSENQTYYIAMTAYDTSNNESGYSEEISAEVPSSFGGSKLGVFTKGNWSFDLNGNAQLDGEDAGFFFWSKRGIPVVGNWNGTPGSVGVFYKGNWYLDWDGNDQWDEAVDKVYTFGAPSCLPVVGNWNGDVSGLDKIGVFCDGIWELDFNGNGLWDPLEDSRYLFGTSGDIPVAGDWDGDGFVREIGVFRDGEWYLDLDGDGEPPVEATYFFGSGGDIPVVGDWNGDGFVREIGVFRKGVWHLDLSGDGIWNPQEDGEYFFGRKRAKPVVGR